jgi:hypothetical protein
MLRRPGRCTQSTWETDGWSSREGLTAEDAKNAEVRLQEQREEQTEEKEHGPAGICLI